MEGSPERYRVLSLEEARHAFRTQLQIFPELSNEVTALAGGSMGVLSAIIETSADEISYAPDEATTPQRIRSFVGAPEDDNLLDQWRGPFWEQFKAARHARSSQ